MTNEKKLEILSELKKGYEGKFRDFDIAVEPVIPALRILEKLFGAGDLQRLAIDYIRGDSSLEDVRNAMS